MLLLLSVAWLVILHWRTQDHERLKTGVGLAAIAFGFSGVYCMSCLYLLPAQVAWNLPATIVSFVGSTVASYALNRGLLAPNNNHPLE
jgi:hypothetical protein